MKQKCFFLIHFLFLFSTAFPQLLWEEPFPSTALLEPSDQAQVLDGSLDFHFHRESGGRLRLRDCNHGLIYPADFLRQKETAPIDTLYISFLLRSLNDSSKDKYAGLFLYQDDKEIFGVGNDYASDKFSFWGSDGRGIPIGQVPTQVDKNIHKIVIRIRQNPDGPEHIRIWLDPICLRPQHRQPAHIITDYEQELPFNHLRLRTGDRDNTWEFDELRIGTDWESVTQPDTAPGEYLGTILKTAAEPGKAEMVGERTARFWPAGADESKALPSFAIEKPRTPTGPVPRSWKLKPKFSKAKECKYVVLEVPAETDLYGTGEVTGGLLRNGYTIILYNKDNYGYGKPDQLYQSHPWVLGLREDGSAFGVIFDTPWQAQLDLKTAIVFSTPLQAPDFPVYVFEGAGPQEVMIQLGELTGRMPMPPRWALGYHQCRYSYYPDARVREIADTFRAKQIPCDVIWLDIDYMNGFRIFTFDPARFPDPKGLNTYLHSLGFKSIWMIDPGVKYEPGYFVYDSGTKEDVWVLDPAGKPFIGPVWPGDCVFPDFTMPRTRRWWAQLYQDFLAKGIDGIWNDMNEPAVFNALGTMPPDCFHRGGDNLPAGPHIQYHNVYGLLMVKSSREGILQARPNRRPFILSRANFLGGHRYAATWTGDNKAVWEHLKWSIPMSLNLGLSGQPFNGPDIGGFDGNAAPDLWAHWISVGAFYPFSRAHTTKESDAQEPWAFGPETEKAARIALQRRYRLLPYLYTLFRQSHLTGLPVMRPVLFAEPKDLSLRMEEQAFLLGEDLLIIPRWAVNPSLPSGIWRKIAFTPEEAGDPYQCELKLRGGAILPLGKIIQNTEENSLDELTLLVCLDKNGTARGTLYEDGGDGYEYESGDYLLTEYTARQDGRTVSIQISRQEGRRPRSLRSARVELITETGIRTAAGEETKGIVIPLDE